MDRVAEEAGIANDPFTFDIIGKPLMHFVPAQPTCCR